METLAKNHKNGFKKFVYDYVPLPDMMARHSGYADVSMLYHVVKTLPQDPNNTNAQKIEVLRETELLRFSGDPKDFYLTDLDIYSVCKIIAFGLKCLMMCYSESARSFAHDKKLAKCDGAYQMVQIMTHLEFFKPYDYKKLKPTYDKYLLKFYQQGLDFD